MNVLFYRRIRAHTLRSVVILLTVVGSTCTVAGVELESSDQRFVDGLRQRRLFLLAEMYCLERLNDPTLTEVGRAQMVIECSRTFGRHAIDSRPAERTGLWQQALDVTGQFEQNYPDHPRRLLVQVQSAVILLARGELDRQEAEIGTADATRNESVRVTLRAAIGRLETLDQQTAQQLRQRLPISGGLSENELLSLQKHIRHQLARGYRNQALAYLPDSADRIGALTKAIRLLQPLSQLSADHPLTWSSQIDIIVCQRLLGNLGEVERHLQILRSSSPPTAAILRSRAEQVRLELDRGNIERALQVLAQGREVGGQTSAELDFAHVQTYIAGWQAAGRQGGPEQIQLWQSRTLEMVEVIEQNHGGYWTRRAELLLSHTAASGGNVENLDVLARSARNFFLRRQYDDAIAAYDRAATSALAMGETNRAFELQATAGRIQHDLGHSTDALNRFRTLALDHSTHSQAGDIHLWAIVNAAELARKKDPPSMELYAQLLAEHLERWPHTSSADTARWWLGRLLEHQSNWTEAVDAYAGVTAESARFADAVAACGHCWMRVLEQLQGDGHWSDAEAARAAQYFETVIRGGRPDWPKRWSPAARVAAQVAAHIHLKRGPTGFALAEEILAAAYDNVGESPPEWQSTIQSLRVVSLAGLKRYAEAKVEIQKLPSETPRIILRTLKSLRPLGDSAERQDRHQLADLQLTALARLAGHSQQLEPSERLVAAQVHAEALAASERWPEALAAYERLAVENPDHAELQVGHAQLLLRHDDPQRLAMARDRWREISRRTRPKTDRWYQARYSLALAHYKLNDSQRAAGIIRLVKTVPPGLENTRWKSRFLELLELCQK